MISILIPTYNYDISNLLIEIHKQASKANIKFEIICFDDKSTKYTVENNTTIDSLTYAKIIISEDNVGRTDARQKLCNESIYNWLLFLDADVMPKDDFFFQNYAEQIKSENDAIYGGITYVKEKPKNEFILRWKYGRTCEDVPAKIRNLKPYQVITSGCFLIRKAIFIKINSKINTNRYGLDNYFASLLKQNKVNVLHINNEVYHLGIENSITYLKKSEDCILTLLWLLNNDKIRENNNKLLSVFSSFKKLKLNYLMSAMYKLFSTHMSKNLVGSNPNIYLLQFYKLSYICYKDLN